MPFQGKLGLIGKKVVDPEGLELGFVSDADERYLYIAKGHLGKFLLVRNLIANHDGNISLRGSLLGLLTGLAVKDSLGKDVGKVKDIVESEDILDSIIVEDPQGEMLIVLVEDLHKIEEAIYLDITETSLKKKQ